MRRRRRKKKIKERKKNEEKKKKRKREIRGFYTNFSLSQEKKRAKSNKG